MKLEKLLEDYKKLNNFDKKLTPAQLEAAKKAAQEQLVQDGQKAYGLLKANCEDAAHLACLLTRLVVDIDNYASEEEYQLFLATTGIKMDRNEFNALTKNGNDPAFLEELDAVVDNLSTSGKEAALCFVAIFLVGDRELTAKEYKVFAKLEA